MSCLGIILFVVLCVVMLLGLMLPSTHPNGRVIRGFGRKRYRRIPNAPLSNGDSLWERERQEQESQTFDNAVGILKHYERTREKRDD